MAAARKEPGLIFKMAKSPISPVQSTSMRDQGKIIQRNEAKGFGFVTPKGRNQAVFPMGWAMLFAALLSGAVLAGAMPVIVALAYLVLSLVTFLAYALDKSAAEAGRWRTQESTLHLFGLAGGWPGALLAQQLLRHKSSKREFQAAFWMTVMLNCGALVWLALPYGVDVRLLLSRMV